jgi:DNA processing protein
VVGPSWCTADGEERAQEIACGLSDAGTVVVSGGSEGVEAWALRGAMAGSTPTVCLLPCGVDVPYPPQNEALLERVVHAGALASQFPPSARPSREALRARALLLAAASEGTVVVEGERRSWAAEAARKASAIGRLVMAVPGPVTSGLSALPHQLLVEGRAELVTCAADVQSALASRRAPAVRPDRPGAWETVRPPEPRLEMPRPGRARAGISI